MSLDLIQDQRSRIDGLEAQLREKDRMITGMREALRRASNFKHDDLAKRVEGIQILLGKAAEYQPREQKRGRR